MKTPPLRITATGTIHATEIFKIRKVVLVAPVIDAEVVLTDAADRPWVHLKSVADASDQIDFTGIELELTGLKVPTLTAVAVLLIYLGDS